MSIEEAPIIHGNISVGNLVVGGVNFVPRPSPVYFSVQMASTAESGGTDGNFSFNYLNEIQEDVTSLAQQLADWQIQHGIPLPYCRPVVPTRMNFRPGGLWFRELGSTRSTVINRFGVLVPIVPTPGWRHTATQTSTPQRTNTMQPPV
jgi:hypothetical protein